MNQSPPTSVNIDADDNNKPIAAFWCHQCDRNKARKYVTQLSSQLDDPEAKDTTNSLPIIKKSGIKKNTLMAVTPEGDAVFVMDMKRGTQYYV